MVLKSSVAATLFLAVAAVVLLVRRTAAAKQREQQISSSVETFADGHIRLGVVNTSGSPITALAAVGTRTLIAKPITVRSVRFFDSVLNPFGPKEIMPNGSYIFTFFGPNPPADQFTRDVQLKAAIFADGSTWGDAEWINILSLRRSSALKYSSEAMQIIETGSLDGSPREDLTRQLTQLQSDEMKAAKTTAEKQMADVVFANALLALQDTAQADGGKVPLSESIARARSRLLVHINGLEASKPNSVN